MLLLPRCALRTFHMTDVKTRVIRLRGVEGRNARDHFIHSHWNSKRMLATYMRRMRKNNLEIRIAGDKMNPQ